MHYQGGKAPESRFIGPYINKIRKPGQPYWEPFVGAGSVLARIENKGINWASDLHPYLIAMYKAMQKGWRPPLTGISEEQYAEAKAGKLSPELTGFIGFGCSWGGKWFGGYARNKKGEKSWDYSIGCARSLIRKFESMPPTQFEVANYLDVEPLPGSIIYCDPPYEGRTSYKVSEPFDHEEFWEWVRFRSKSGHTVLVSSFEAPDDFRSVLSINAATETRGTKGRVRETERLFMYDPNYVPVSPWDSWM